MGLECRAACFALHHTIPTHPAMPVLKVRQRGVTKLKISRLMLFSDRKAERLSVSGGSSCHSRLGTKVVENNTAIGIRHSEVHELYALSGSS